MDIETPFGEGSYLLPLFVLVIMIRVNIETINLIIVVTIFIISNLTFPVAPRRGAWILELSAKQPLPALFAEQTDYYANFLRVEKYFLP